MKKYRIRWTNPRGISGTMHNVPEDELLTRTDEAWVLAGDGEVNITDEIVEGVEYA